MNLNIRLRKDLWREKEGERLVGKYDYDRKDREAMLRESNELYDAYPPELGYRFEIHETYVKKHNLMGGAEFLERYDTPYFCSPASESYWSM